MGGLPESPRSHVATPYCTTTCVVERVNRQSQTRSCRRWRGQKNNRTPVAAAGVKRNRSPNAARGNPAIYLVCGCSREHLNGRAFWLGRQSSATMAPRELPIPNRRNTALLSSWRWTFTRRCDAILGVPVAKVCLLRALMSHSVPQAWPHVVARTRLATSPDTL